MDVEREEDKVIITVGSGGAFASGSANLTPEAVEIMNRIAEVNAEGNSDIKVSGHTDDVPLIFGSNYRDNWDLAAARSASVVQAFASKLFQKSKPLYTPFFHNHIIYHFVQSPCAQMLQLSLGTFFRPYDPFPLGFLLR